MRNGARLSSLFLTAASCAAMSNGFAEEPAKVDYSGTVSFFGEYLYWTAPQSDLEFARIGKGPQGFPGVVLGKDHIRRVTYDWASGFRVGASYANEYSYFRPELDYTRYHTDGSKSASAQLNAQGSFEGVPTLPPTVAPSSENFYINGVATIQHAHSRAKLNLDYIDLKLAGADHSSRSFVWNWGFGFRGAILKSEWHTKYNVQFNDGFGPQKTKIDWKYSGLGVLLDLCGRFNVGYGFSFYEEVTGSFMLGNLHTVSRSFITPPGIAKTGICDIHQSKYRVVPVIESQTGVAWKYEFTNKVAIQINAAFDYMKWVEVGENKFYTIPEGGRYKSSEIDVDTYGLTTGLTVTF